MYSIFHPLDPNERLPRELILEGRRYRFFDLRFMELLGFAYLPALIFGVVVLTSYGVQPLVAFGVAGIAFLAVFIYIAKGRYR